ncbi:hypothetical protein KAR91_41780 [Candidatus Pacearchaeota archaeon]|nr:hypothetical protein [Candidatus Pacearchaeota archaeon]
MTKKIRILNRQRGDNPINRNQGEIKESCSNCKYGKELKKDSLFCLRYPPAVMPVQAQHPISGQMHSAGLSVCPEVAEETWCGEFVKGPNA